MTMLCVARTMLGFIRIKMASGRSGVWRAAITKFMHMKTVGTIGRHTFEVRHYLNAVVGTFERNHSEFTFITSGRAKMHNHICWVKMGMRPMRLRPFLLTVPFLFVTVLAMVMR